MKIRDTSGLIISQPAGRATKGFESCFLEIFEKQVLGYEILMFLNVFEVLSGANFNNILSHFSHFYHIYLTAVGKPKASKKV